MITIKKKIIEDIEKKFDNNIARMENTKFYIEMGDTIEDWQFYLALGYLIAKSKNQCISCYEIVN
jgi:hypothetical protein